MNRALLSLALLFLLTACGEKKAMTPAVVTIAGITSSLSTTSNFLVSAFNLKSGEMYRVVANSASVEMILPNGYWRFSAYHWSTGSNLDGDFRCAQAEVELDGNENKIGLLLTMANCASDHTTSDFLDSGELQELALVSCGQPAFPTPGIDCQASAGLTSSYRLVLPEVILSPASNPKFGSASIGSECIEIATAGAPQLSGKRFPSGTDNSPFPFVVEAYPFSSCTGTPIKVNFEQGLRTASNTNKFIYDYTSPDTSWVYLRHAVSANFVAVAPSFNIPAEANYPMDLSKFVTGGVGAVVFTHNGAGSISGNSYTHDGTAQSLSVTATDDAGNTAVFGLNTVVATTEKDFNDRTAANWSLARTASSAATMTTSSNQSSASANTARFLYDNSDGSFGFVSEGSRINKLLQSNTITNASWTKSFSTANINGSVFFTSNASYDVQDTDGSNLGYATQTVSGLSTGLDHTLSIYVKRNNGFAGFYFGSTSSDCIGLVVNTSNGAATEMQAGSICNLTGQTYSVEAVNTNWWRVVMTRSVSNAVQSVRIYPAWNSSLTSTATTNATGIVTVDGIQFEQGSNASSQIITTNTSLSRDGDKITNTVLGAAIKKEQGTLLLKWKTRTEPSLGYIFQAFNTTNPSESQFRIIKNSNDVLSVDFIHGGGVVRSITSAGLIGNGTNTLILSYDTAEILLKRGGAGTVYTADRSGTALGGNFTDTSLGTQTGGTTNATNQLTKKLVHWDAHFPEEVLTQILP